MKIATITKQKQKLWNFNPQQIPGSEREYPKCDALNQPPSKQFPVWRKRKCDPSKINHKSFLGSFLYLRITHDIGICNIMFFENVQEGFFGKSNELIQWRTLCVSPIHAWYLSIPAHWMMKKASDHPIAGSKFSHLFLGSHPIWVGGWKPWDFHPCRGIEEMGCFG